MTDTGQVPGEGLPENAGRVEQPGVAAPDAYTYLSDSPAEDVDLLLPGAQGAWGNEIEPPAPAPVVETVHQPGPHETDGRDSGSVDLGGVRPPEPQRPARRLPAPAPSPAAAPAASRRPLHLGPPLPDLSASPVRSLADRGPADLPARQPGPPTLGPEYLDVPRTPGSAAPQAASWPAQGAAAPAAALADAAQAAVARVATQAVGTAVAGEGEQTPAAAHDEQVAPVVPGPGAPGDAVAGGDAGGVGTGGDAGASVPVDAGVPAWRRWALWCRTRWTCRAPVRRGTGRWRKAGGAEGTQEAVVPEAPPRRNSPWARSLLLRSLPLRRRRTPGRPWSCPSRPRRRRASWRTGRTPPPRPSPPGRRRPLTRPPVRRRPRRCRCRRAAGRPCRRGRRARGRFRTGGARGAGTRAGAGRRRGTGSAGAGGSGRRRPGHRRTGRRHRRTGRR